MSRQGPDNGRNGFVLYYYEPSLIAAGVCAGVFFLSSFVHAFQIYRTKTWYFIPMVIGAQMEGLGYVGRMMSHKDPNALAPYIMQSVLLLVAPALFAAAIYMVLGRLIRTVNGEDYCIIRVNWLTKVFVLGDVFTFFVQASGAGLLSSGDHTTTGRNVILGGLGLQILFFGLFIVVALIFHVRMHRSPTAAALAHQEQAPVSWRRMLLVLYFASQLIIIRSGFRLVEYIQGHDGALMRKERWLYMFDALLMAQTVLVFNWYHPSRSVFQGGVVERYEMEDKPEISVVSSV
ncbi:envelope glycoprotein [Marasmius crinis-equi]|uniref:Envelope glycoprotein n=1 Tax=Marasmius crinis-equi TaxID=585013 RepID=A0ABR3FBN2_9AGAR